MTEKQAISEIGSLSSTTFCQLYEEARSEDKETLLYARCASDLELFASVFFPHYCTVAFNQFHTHIFRRYRYSQRKVRRVDAAPRGAAKSTIISLITLIHDACYGLETFVVLISNTAPLSERKLKDVRDEVLSNGHLVDVYGLRFANSKPGETQFILENAANHKTLFMAFGRGAQIRGVRFGPNRPSKVVLDDVEHSEEVYNEAVRAKTLDWFREDVSKVGDPATNIEFVGTVLHRQSLLAELLQNPRYEGSLFKSIISWSEREDLWDQWRAIYINFDDDNRLDNALAFYQANEAEMLRGTEVLWPEREPYYALMEEMLEIGRRAFFKEKQNEPLGAEDKIFERIHYYRETPEGLLVESTGTLVKWSELTGNGIAAIDPSTGSKGQTKPKGGKLGDFTSIVNGWYDRQGRVFVHNDWTKRAPPTQYISQIFEVWEKWQFNRMAVEVNLYRNLLVPNIKTERERRNAERAKKQIHPIKLEFQEVEATENKQERIFRMEPKVTYGWILFNKTLSTEGMNQLKDFPHAAHDDFPDVIEMLWDMVHHRYRAGGVGVNAMGR